MRAQRLYNTHVFGGVIVAAHARKRCVTAALQRQVELRAELWLPRHARDVAVGEQFRLERAEPHAVDAADRAGKLHRVDQAQPKLAAVGRQVDPDKHRLAVAGARQPFKLGAQLPGRLGAHGAARLRDDTVGAVAVAAVLDFDEGARAFAEGGRTHRLERLAALVRRDGDDAAACFARPAHKLDEGRAVARAGDHIGFGQARGVVGERLRVTACQYDGGARAKRAETAQRAARFLVAGGGDGAGIDDIDVGGRVRRYDFVAGVGELLREDLRLVLVHLAAQGVKGSFHLYTPSKFD